MAVGDDLKNFEALKNAQKMQERGGDFKSVKKINLNGATLKVGDSIAEGIFIKSIRIGEKDKTKLEFTVGDLQNKTETEIKLIEHKVEGDLVKTSWKQDNENIFDLYLPKTEEVKPKAISKITKEKKEVKAPIKKPTIKSEKTSEKTKEETLILKSFQDQKEIPIGKESKIFIEGKEYTVIKFLSGQKDGAPLIAIKETSKLSNKDEKPIVMEVVKFKEKYYRGEVDLFVDEKRKKELPGSIVKPEIKKPKIKKRPEVLEKEKTEKEIIEILKNEKISQIVIHAKEQEESASGALTFDNDLDTQGALDLFQNLNKNKSENFIVSIIPKNGSLKNLTEKRNGWKVFLDVSGEGIRIDKKNKIIYLDHHEPGKKDPTSTTEILYNLMKKAETLEQEPKWLKNFIKFLNNVENLTSLENIKKGGDKEFFKKEWPKTLLALADKIPYKNLKLLFQSDGNFVNPPITEQLENPSKPLTDEQWLKGEFGQIEVEVVEKNKKTGKREKITKKISDIIKKNFTEWGEVQNTIKGIEKTVAESTKRKLNLEDTAVGKIVYQKIKKLPEDSKEKNIFIPKHLAFIGTKYSGFDTFVNWNEERKEFFINSFHPNLSEIV
ncbi:MAG: hypothetical protein WC662_04905, partial [Candidatus Paceibacterota bacterium]